MFFVSRHVGRQAVVQAVRRHGARDEGRRLAHGTNLLRAQHRGPEVLRPRRSRAQAAQDGPAGRAQAPGAAQPPALQHTRELRQRRRHRLRQHPPRHRSRRLWPSNDARVALRQLGSAADRGSETKRQNVLAVGCGIYIRAADRSRATWGCRSGFFGGECGSISWP